MVKHVKTLLLSHFYIDIVLFIFSSVMLFIGMCLHQLEEYRFPGGFIWGFNKIFMNSDMPDRYPSDRLSATLVDVVSMIVAAPFLYWHYSTILGACLALFAILEVLGHLMFGILAFKKYHLQGKETIYFPSSFTSWIFFAPLSFTLIYQLISTQLITANQWWWTVGCLVAYMVIGFAWPSVGFTDRNTPYIYDEEPREGFYSVVLPV